MDINQRGILALVTVTILAILFTLAYEKWREYARTSGKTPSDPGGFCGCGNSQACGTSGDDQLLLFILPDDH